MLETVITSAIVACLTGIITFLVQERRLRATLRTEFMAERAVRMLLKSEKYRKRSFAAIENRVKGFEDDELRKLLVRAGAVHFQGDDQEELWGLIERNEKSL